MIDRIYWHILGRILAAVYTGHITSTERWYRYYPSQRRPV